MAQEKIDGSQVSTANMDLSAADGSVLTGVDAASLNGQTVGTGANQIVSLDGSAMLPAVDGSQLTNLPSGGESLIDTQVFTSSGTWTRPSGAARIEIEMVSGGGGGGGMAGINPGVMAAGGGGGGAYLYGEVYAPNIAASYSVVVTTTGGTGGIAGGGNGGTGGLVTFDSGGTESMRANGGGGGTGVSGASSSAGVGGTGGTQASSPGANIQNYLLIRGANGDDGFIDNISETYHRGGNGGDSRMGHGAKMRNYTTGPGIAANSYGAGGSGAHARNNTATSAGGAGSSGIVIVRTYG